MYPKTHFVVGLIFSLFLLFDINLSVIILFFLSSFLIDLDHYILYVFKKKDFSLKRAYWWFVERTEKLKKLSVDKRGKYKEPFLIFHGIEFWAFLYILSLKFSVFSPILIGCLFHMVFDWIDILEKRYGLEAFFGRISWTYVLIKNKKKKKLK